MFSPRPEGQGSRQMTKFDSNSVDKLTTPTSPVISEILQMGDSEDDDIYLAALESVEKGYTSPPQYFTGKAHVPQGDGQDAWNGDQQGG